MANPWDKPATKYSQGRSFSSRTTNSNWTSVPWKDLYKACKDAQEVAAYMADQDNLTRYKAYIQKKEVERAALNPEAGSWEGNLSDEIPYQKILPGTMFKIKQKASVAAIEDFITQYNLKSFGVSLLQQLTKNISEYKLSDISGADYSPAKAAECLREGSEDGLISSASLYKQAFTDDTMMGIYNFLMMDTRSSILEKQYAAPAKSYCALVPLIMNAFKYHSSVPYSHWQRSQIRGITNVKLADAMLWDEELPSNDEILQARAEGLLIKSGPKMGDIRNPTYTFKLYGKSCLSDYPEYVQVMASQIWCAHPQNRTKFMVLDHLSWDNIPAPLIATESLISTVSKSSKNATSDFEW